MGIFGGLYSAYHCHPDQITGCCQEGEIAERGNVGEPSVICSGHDFYLDLGGSYNILHHCKNSLRYTLKICTLCCVESLIFFLKENNLMPKKKAHEKMFGITSH